MQTKLSGIIRGMVLLLVIQYILGMGVSLFGTDDPAKRTFFTSFLFISHTLVAIVALIGAVYVLYAVGKSGKQQWSRSAKGGFFSMLAAFIAGIATMALKDTASDIASFVMALSFLGAFVNYLFLFFASS